jgi:hypothetical protein
MTAKKNAAIGGGKKSWTRFMAEALLAAALCGIFSLLFLEASVRLLWPQQRTYEDWIAPDARYGLLYKPNGHFRYPFPGSDYVMDLRTNSLGFRDEEPAPPKDGQKSILFLGDSYTMGYALDIENRFDKKLAQLCRENGSNYRFINAGVDGWGTVQESRYAQDHFETLRPDIVVLTFCENDPYDDAWFLAHEGPVWVETRPVRLFLKQHCQLYRLASNLRWMRQHRDEVRQLGRDKKQDGETDPAGAMFIPEPMWAQSLQHLRDFHAAFLRHNPNGILLVQASAPTSADVRSHLSLLDNGKNLLYIDLSAAVSSVPVAERRLPHDPHWSAKVHEISAHALYERIARLWGRN